MMSSLNKLKIERAQAKSKVTRFVNILDPLLDKKGSDASDVQDKVSDHAAKLEDGLVQLKRAHKKYAECLESETDENQIETVADTNNQYLTDAEAPAYETLIKIKKFKVEVAKFTKNKETEENILPGLKTTFKRAVEKFRLEVSNIASFLEDFESKTASQIKEIPSLRYLDFSGEKASLEKAFSDLFDIHAAYSEALESIEMDIITAANVIFPDKPFSMEQSIAVFKSWRYQASIVLGAQREVLRDEEIKENKFQAPPSGEKVLIKLPKAENMTKINDAEKFAEEDAEFKSKVEARNELESYAYSLKNQLNDKEKLGGKLSDDDQSKIEDITNEKIKWLEVNTDASAEDLKALKKEMEDIVQPIAKPYQEQGGAPPGGEKEEYYDMDKSIGELDPGPDSEEQGDLHGPLQVTFKSSGELHPGPSPENVPGSLDPGEKHVLVSPNDHFSSLDKIVNTTTFVLRLGGRIERKISKNYREDSLKAKYDNNPISTMEHKILLEEKKVDMRKFSGFNLEIKEVVVSPSKTLILQKSRVKNFHIKFQRDDDSVYVLPNGNLSKKIFSKFHNKIDTICPNTREFWIPSLRKIVTSSSQHQNGSAKLLIKLCIGVIQPLMSAIGSYVLFLNKLLAVLKEKANRANERSIGLKPNQNTDPHPFPDNHLRVRKAELDKHVLIFLVPNDEAGDDDGDHGNAGSVELSQPAPTESRARQYCAPSTQNKFPREHSAPFHIKLFMSKDSQFVTSDILPMLIHHIKNVIVFRVILVVKYAMDAIVL